MQTSPAIINRAENQDYIITRLSKINLADLARLYYEVYNRAIKEDFFARKYDTRYTNVENIGFIAYDINNKPVAYYGVIPCFMEHENQIILVAQSADSMTHPSHRSRGLFVKLSNMTFDLCREEGIRLIFGFPNENSYPLMVSRLGWIETEKLKLFTIPVSSFLGRRFFQRRVKFPKTVLKENILTEKGIPNSVTSEGYTGIYRSNDYLQYKTYSQTHVLKLRSSTVWIKLGKHLIVGDILLQDSSVDFFHDLKNIAKVLRVNNIFFQASNGLQLTELFAKCYKPTLAFPVLLKDFDSGIPIEKIKFTFADIDIF